MTRRCRIGVIGAGAIVQKVHLPVLANQPDAQVEWITDRDAMLAKRVAASFGLRAIALPASPEALPACDLALLATPLHARADYLAEFARRATPLFAEKPFTSTAREHEQALAAFGATPVWCGYMRRTYANVRMLRRIVESRWFGALRGIRYAEGGRTTSTDFGSSTLDLGWHRGGGVLRDLGCHGLDLIAHVAGARTATISRCGFEWDAQTDREAVARFRLEPSDPAQDACTVDFRVSWLRPQANRIELLFDRAAVRCGIKPGTGAEIASDESFRDAVALQIDCGGARTEYASYHLEWREVLGALGTGTSGDFGAGSSLWTTRLVEALYAAGGAPASLRPDTVTR